MTVKHRFQSARPDNNDAGDVQPSQWNDVHELDGLLALLDAVAPTPNSVFTVNGSNQIVLLATAAFAPTFSAQLTGVPTAPTAAQAVNSTQIATTEYVRTAITNLVGGAPGALDTLKEIADAIGDNANYAAGITASLAVRLRVDAAQGLNSTQKAQGVANLGLATVAVSGNYADLAGKPTLGTSAALDVGTTSLKVVQLDSSARLPAVDGSLLTNVHSALSGYYAGLPVSAPGGGATFTVGAGVAADSTGATIMTFTGMTKTLSAFVAGNGNGALDTSAAAANTYYYVHLISTAAGVTDILFSLSATSPTLPSGYTKFRRIGTLPTNASVQITAFTHYGDEFIWGAALSEYNQTPLNTTSTLISLGGLPPNIPLSAKLRFLVFGTGANGVLLQSPDEAASVANSPNGNLQGSWTGTGQCSGEVTLRTSTRQIRCASSVAGASLSLVTIGFIDRRGRDLGA